MRPCVHDKAPGTLHHVGYIMTNRDPWLFCSRAPITYVKGLLFVDNDKISNEYHVDWFFFTHKMLHDSKMHGAKSLSDKHICFCWHFPEFLCAHSTYSAVQNGSRLAANIYITCFANQMQEAALCLLTGCQQSYDFFWKRQRERERIGVCVCVLMRSWGKRVRRQFFAMSVPSTLP